MTMDEVMLLWGGRAPDLPIEWLIWDRGNACRVDGGELHSGRELADLRSLALLRPCYLLLPQEQVLVTQVKLPTDSRAARQAIPFQLEEQLCDDPDRLHFAVGKSQGGGRYTVLVISRQLLQGWHDLLVSADLPIKGVFADAQVLESEASRWTRLDVAGRVLLKGDDGSGMALSQEELQQLSDVLEGETPIRTLAVEPGDTPLVSLARHLNLERAIDLMQGDFRLRDPVRGLLQRWRTPALLILLLAVLGLTQVALENYRLTQQKHELEQRVEALYREAFPEARKIVNPRLQMQRQLEQLRQNRLGAPLLRVLDRSVAAFQQRQDIRLTALRYDADDGRLALELEGPDAESLQMLNDRLQSEGLNSELGQFSSDKRATRGRLTITEVR